MSILYADIPGVTQPISITVSTQHTQSVATASIECISTSKSIGDEINIDLGYNDDHGHIFKGFVKQIERKVPENTRVITAHDVLSRAIDYFFVPTNPDAPFRRQNITAEDLIQDVLEEAGLTDFDLDATSFTFAVTADVYAEVKLVSAYDYAHGIADLLAWHIWADENGITKFKNRKPYFMATGDPDDNQPGWTADTAITTITDSTLLDGNYTKHERDLRNRVVVVGTPGINAEASASSPYLPAGYFKSVALFWPILDSQSIAQNAADYNLDLLNRLSKVFNATVVGNYQLIAHKAVSVNSTKLSLIDDFYIYYAEHQWSAKGYQTTLELRAK